MIFAYMPYCKTLTWKSEQFLKCIFLKMGVIFGSVKGMVMKNLLGAQL